MKQKGIVSIFRNSQWKEFLHKCQHHVTALIVAAGGVTEMRTQAVEIYIEGRE